MLLHQNRHHRHYLIRFLDPRHRRRLLSKYMLHTQECRFVRQRQHPPSHLHHRQSKLSKWLQKRLPQTLQRHQYQLVILMPHLLRRQLDCLR